MTQQKANILIVDDDQGVLYTARMILKQHFTNIQAVNNPATAMEWYQNNECDVVLLDMNFRSGATDGKEGIDLLQRMLQEKNNVHIITNTAYGDIDLAVKAMKLGAKDFIVKPWKKEQLLNTVKNAVDYIQSQRELKEVKSREVLMAKDLERASGEFLWKDPAMGSVVKMIGKVAKTDANVLILGENGTGKELVARAIHQKSHRADKPFIKVDLGTIAETLFESELFGHAKGAFTDAKEEKAGRFEIANGGTLFLDEIGNLSMNMQAKILTTIQNKKIHRVGSSKEIELDIRLICATNADLYLEVDDGNFRQDLLYRINTVEIEVPPLRERKRDITFLFHHFLKVFSNKYQKSGLKMAEQDLLKLTEYPWPGNVRELQHAVERAVILSESRELKAQDLVPKGDLSLQQVGNELDIRSVEKVAIQNALTKANGNLTNTAKELGIGRTTLYRKMKKYNLDV